MANKRCPVRLGLTGGIGSGKSTVGGMFASLGATMIDADQIARAVTGPGGDAMDAIRSTFGADFVDASGALDRTRMRELAFSRPEARTQLEAIVHPLVTRHSLLQTQQAIAAGSRLIVHDIPLLAESGQALHRLNARQLAARAPDGRRSPNACELSYSARAPRLLTARPYSHRSVRTRTPRSSRIR